MVTFHTLNDKRLFKKVFSDGKSWHTPYFVCFFLPDEICRVGFVASKKVGNAVNRNRAKRRMRALFNEFEPSFVPGIYIFVAKNPIVEEDFSRLKDAFLLSKKRLNTMKR